MKTFKSILSVFVGILVIFALSTLTDVILEKSGLMQLPFAANPLWVKLVVVLYRNVYVAIGAYITASMAPVNPMKHVWILAGIGCMLGILGAIAMWHEPPHWYPISLVLLGVPFAWLGGKFKTR
jgi:hypothetical protein